VGDFLVVHDSTSFLYRDDGEREGLGRIKPRSARGKQVFFAHFSLAVAADGTRRPLGVAAFKTWVRGTETSGIEQFTEISKFFFCAHFGLALLSVFGLVAHEKLAALTDAIIDGEANTALTTVKELDEIGKDLQRLLVDLLDHYRNLLVLSLAGGELDVTEADLELLQDQVKRVDSDAVLRIIDALSGAEGRLRYALSKRIYLEIAIIRAIKARQMVSLDVVLKRLNELKAGTTALPAERPKTGNSSPAPAGSIEEAWTYALEHLGKTTPMAKSS
jgi:hypothetical protein